MYNDKQKQIIRKVNDLIHKWDAHATSRGFELFDVAAPLISFDLNSIRVNGRIKYEGSGSSFTNIKIQYNSEVMEMNFDEFINRTVPHEVAHYCMLTLHGKPTSSGMNSSHGRNWKQIMHFFGADPNRCTTYKNTPKSKTKKTFLYMCDCQEHELSIIRHNRIGKGTVYCCNKCNHDLEEVK